MTARQAGIRTVAVGAGATPELRVALNSAPAGAADPIDRVLVDGKGNVELALAELATDTTDGFAYHASCPGAPTGEPTPKPGRVPAIFDSAGRYLWAYIDDTWIKIGPHDEPPPPARAWAESAAATAITAQIPSDDTIPQNSEGAEILAATITPRRASSRIRATVQINFAASEEVHRAIAALFVGSSVAAARAAVVPPNAGQIVLVHEIAPGSTDPLTVKVRCGPNQFGGALTLNSAAEGRALGGAAAATLALDELWI